MYLTHRGLGLDDAASSARGKSADDARLCLFLANESELQFHRCQT